MHFQLLSAAILSIASTASAAVVPHDISSVVKISFTCPGQTRAHPNIICDAHGNLPRPVLLHSGTAKTVNKCAAACRSLSTCISFGYSSNKMCNLYRSDLAHMGFVREATTTAFYNHHCFDCQPTTTTTTTMSATPTSSSIPSSSSSSSSAALPLPTCGIPPNIPFHIQIASVPQGASNSNPSNYNYDTGDYADVSSEPSDGTDVTVFEPGSNTAPTPFTLDNDCHLVDPAGDLGFQKLNSGSSSPYNSDILHLGSEYYIDNGRYPEPTCSVAPGTMALTCVDVDSAFNVFFTCFFRLRLGKAVPPGCEPVDLVAVLAL